MVFSEKESALEKAILNKIGLPPDEVKFVFSTSPEKVKLEVFTINPRHSQMFLFHAEIALTIEDVLKKMLEYVEEHRLSENSYTIQWIDVSNPKQFNTSYFRAQDLFVVLEKFYHGRDKTSCKIFSIHLNPVS